MVGDGILQIHFYVTTSVKYEEGYTENIQNLLEKWAQSWQIF